MPVSQGLGMTKQPLSWSARKSARADSGEGIGAELVGGRVAAERHSQVEFGEEHLQHRFHAGLAVEREAPEVGPSRSTPSAPSARALRTSEPPRTPLSRSTRVSSQTARRSPGQSVERGDRAVELAAAVVRDDQRVRPRSGARRAWSGCRMP